MMNAVLSLALLSLVSNATTPSSLRPLNEKYLVSNSTVTFIGAYLSCKRLGYKMVSVTNEDEYIQVNSSLVSPPYYYWLGGAYASSQGFESKWVWLETGNELIYTHWAKGQPNLIPEDNCIRRNYDGTWTAKECDAKYCYICEK